MYPPGTSLLSLSLSLKVLGKRHQHTSTVNTVAPTNKSECPAEGNQGPALPAPFVVHTGISVSYLTIYRRKACRKVKRRVEV